MGPSASFGLQAIALAWFEDDAPGFGLGFYSFGEGCRVLLHHGEGIIVDRDNHLGLDEFDCPQGIFGPHSVVVTDGLDSLLDAFFTYEFHVVEKAGIAGVVDVLALDAQ